MEVVNTSPALLLGVVRAHKSCPDEELNAYSRLPAGCTTVLGLAAEVPEAKKQDPSLSRVGGALGTPVRSCVAQTGLPAMLKAERAPSPSSVMAEALTEGLEVEAFALATKSSPDLSANAGPIGAPGSGALHCSIPDPSASRVSHPAPPAPLGK